MSTYDAIVLGTGGVGSSALFHLARRGLSVLGLDRFEAGHARGSSHGQTRLIRKAYFEHPDYVPLLHRSYELWFELEELQQKKLFHQVGLIEIGPRNGVVVPGVLASAEEHGLAVEELESGDLADRFPGFVAQPDHGVVFEPDAGFLMVEESVKTHLSAAESCGAECRYGESIVAWEKQGTGFQIRTDQGAYSTARLIITAGAWTPELLPDLGVQLVVKRKHLHWYQVGESCYRLDQGCPGFLFETPSGFFYGFPELDERGLKVAEHSGGDVVGDPLHADRNQDPVDRQRVEDFMSVYLPQAARRHTDHAVCFYTFSPDEHFLLGQVPDYPQAFYVAGLSGHGFKFTTVLGEVLCDLAIDGRSKLPIEFLSEQRFS